MRQIGFFYLLLCLHSSQSPLPEQGLERGLCLVFVVKSYGPEVRVDVEGLVYEILHDLAATLDFFLFRLRHPVQLFGGHRKGRPREVIDLRKAWDAVGFQLKLIDS